MVVAWLFSDWFEDFDETKPFFSSDFGDKWIRSKK